jgi:hypothetical protein
MRTVLESIHDSGERGPNARIVDNMMVGRQWHIKIDAYEQPLSLDRNIAERCCGHHMFPSLRRSRLLRAHSSCAVP